MGEKKQKLFGHSVTSKKKEIVNKKKRREGF
jgi:hypothetical protein